MGSCGCSLCPHGKARASIAAALLFVVLASPDTFALVQRILGSLIRITSAGVPTPAGLIVHSAVFGLITYLLMTRKRVPRGRYE